MLAVLNFFIYRSISRATATHNNISSAHRRWDIYFKPKSEKNSRDWTESRHFPASFKGKTDFRSAIYFDSASNNTQTNNWKIWGGILKKRKKQSIEESMAIFHAGGREQLKIQIAMWLITWLFELIVDMANYGYTYIHVIGTQRWNLSIPVGYLKFAISGMGCRRRNIWFLCISANISLARRIFNLILFWCFRHFEQALLILLHSHVTDLSGKKFFRGRFIFPQIFNYIWIKIEFLHWKGQV